MRWFAGLLAGLAGLAGLACEGKREPVPHAAASIEMSTPEPSASPGPVAATHEVVTIVGGPYELRAELLSPAQREPAPAIVWNHGSEQEPSLRWMGATARWFQAHGFVVLVVYRRGASGSSGPHWSERVDRLTAVGVSRDEAIVRALDEDIEDVMVAGEWLAEHHRVDRRRLFVAGCSFGGVLSLLAAERGAPFAKALDFAGGSMMWQTHEAVRRRMFAAVRAASLPIFLLQAANDFDTAPTVELAAEMARLGKPHHHKVFPPFGQSPAEGHAGFCNHAQALWGLDVLDFLEED